MGQVKKVLAYIGLPFDPIFVSCALLYLGVSSSTFSQISSENVDRHFITNARAAALADATVSDASSISNIYWNPSSLSFLAERSVALNYSLERIRGRDNIMNENVAVPLLDEKAFAVGMGATYSHVGHIEKGSPLAGYGFSQGSLDLALATMPSRFFSIGVLSTVRNGHSGSQNVTVVSSAIGMMYFPSPEIVYGLSYQGIGNGLEYSLDSSGLRTNVGRVSLSQSLQVGVTARFNTLDDNPSVILMGVSQKMFGTKGLIYKVGVEAWPISFLALRIGYWVGTETVAARYGGGIRVTQWRLDYGVSTTELEPRFHQISLSYCFDDHVDHR